MHFAVVTEGVPNLETSGGQQTPWLVIRSLLDAGHRVTASLLLNLHDPWLQGKADKRLVGLRELGTEVVVTHVPPARPTGSPRLARLRRLLAPRIEDVFPAVRLASQVTRVLGEARPEAAFVLDLNPVAATHGLEHIPRMAALGILPHSVGAVEWEWGRLNGSRSLAVRRYIGQQGLKSVMLQLLSRCEAVCNFGADGAAELRRLGLRSCLYLPNPAHDFGGPDWRRRRALHENAAKAKVLLIGHLRGTFTRYGLHLFADKVLPVLERQLGPEGVEVHIVGQWPPEDELRRKLDSPLVRLRGWVERVEEEFLSAHVLLVPNPVALGNRMRILNGLSCGCCVVAHEANLVGSPELRREENILAAKDGAGLAEVTLRALRDPALRERVAVSGRRTFEQHFAPAVAGARIVGELERLARGGATGR